MSCALDLAELTPAIQFKLRDELVVTQRYGRKGRFRKDIKVVTLDEEQKYLVVPIAIKSRLVFDPAGKLTFTDGCVLDYRDQPRLRPNASAGFKRMTHPTQVLESFSLRDEQIPVVNNVLEKLDRYSTALMDISCAFGKTLVSLYIAVQLGYKFLFVTPRRNLKAQTQNEAGRVCVGHVQIIDTQKPVDPSADGYIISSRILEKYSQEDFPDVATLILDEVHMLFTPKVIPSLLFFQPLYVLGLSATPSRDDGLGKCFSLFLDPRGKEYYDTPKPLRVWTVRSDLEIETGRDHLGEPDYNSIVKVQLTCDWRDRATASLAIRFQAEKVLVACARKEQVRSIIRLIEESGYPTQRMMENDKLKDRSHPITVGIITKMGVGTDFGATVIIIASSVKKRNVIHQLVKRVGRGKDDQPMVIDIVDRNEILERHYEFRRKWYRQQGITSDRSFRMMSTGTVVEIE